MDIEHEHVKRKVSGSFLASAQRPLNHGKMKCKGFIEVTKHRISSCLY